jgi:hypothetical protein
MSDPLKAFRTAQDVYIDYPAEDVMFRYEYRTRNVFRRFYGEAEVQVDYASKLFHEAISGGQQIDNERYARGG